MATAKQQLGEYGEKIVVKHIDCPGCKRHKTLKRLVQNFKCADLICDFCGYLAQVKTRSLATVEVLPKKSPGAAWEPIKERMDAGRYFPIFMVLVDEKNIDKWAIYYLAADLQSNEFFKPRKPLKSTARRAGWQGVEYNLDVVKDKFVRLI